MRFKGFIGASYESRSRNIDCERSVNLYIEKTESGAGKEGEQYALLSSGGLIKRLTLAGGKFRGCYAAPDGQLFAVAGNKFYSISPIWVATELGTLATSTGTVRMMGNGQVIFIVDGTTTAYYFTLASSTFTTQTAADNFPGAETIDFLDLYLIVNQPQSGKVFISGLNGVTWDPLDYFTSEGSPDPVVGLIVCGEQLWVMNDTTTEVFYDSGDALNPFRRVQGAVISIGCAAKYSIARLAGSPYWIGKSIEGHGIVYMANGYTPQRISTHAVEQAIQSYSYIGDAEGFTYQQDGHGFYVLNFPTANSTWVFDVATGAWHERAYTNDGVLERHRAKSHAYAFDKHIVGDYDNGNIYEMSDDALTDDGAPITRLRACPHVTTGLSRSFHHSLQLDMQVGVGIDGLGQGVDPQVMLQFSDDGGYSWSNEKWSGCGKIGNRLRRVIWRRLGASRDRVYRVKITDPVKVAILGAEIQIEQAAN
jgi:hypothetical protein